MSKRYSSEEVAKIVTGEVEIKLFDFDNYGLNTRNTLSDNNTMINNGSNSTNEDPVNLFNMDNILQKCDEQLKSTQTLIGSVDDMLYLKPSETNTKTGDELGNILYPYDESAYDSTLSSLHVQSSDHDEEQSNTNVNDDDSDDSIGNWLSVPGDDDSEIEVVRKYDEREQNCEVAETNKNRNNGGDVIQQLSNEETIQVEEAEVVSKNILTRKRKRNEA